MSSNNPKLGNVSISNFCIKPRSNQCNDWTLVCRVRCTEHRGAARNHFDTAVGDHFNLPGHEVADFNFLPFEKVRSSDPFVIEAREGFWIEKYGVLGEGGMNRRS